MANLWGEGLGAKLDQLILELGEALDNTKTELAAKERWLSGEGPETDFDGPVDVGPERPVDGIGSNPLHEDWGATGQQLLRLGEADFGDGIGTMGGADRPNAREISNTVSQQTEDMPSEVGASDMLWAWGQFIDHDLDLTEAGHGGEFAPIIPPADDPAFPPGSMIPFTRVEPLEGTGVDTPREYPNEITGFLDASMVYGSDEETAASLRVDGGKMLMTEDEFLVLDGENPMAGDVRAGENVGLTSLHTLFAREHNWWVDQLAERDPSLTDDELYAAARQRVEAEIQAITFNEFLPLLLGEDAVPDYEGYDSSVNPGVSVEFSTGVYRLGHSLLSTTIQRLDEDGNVIEAGNLGLRDAFFAPELIEQDGGIAPILRGLLDGSSQQVDTFIVEDVRSFLFGQPGDGGLDLAALNIQRGRDLGVPSYNDLREAIGLDRVESFTEITSDAVLAGLLEDLYGDVDHVDAWIGGLAEDRFGDSLLGETFHWVVLDQFVRVRDGDPFWSEGSALPEEERDALWSTKLSDIIERNGDVEVAQDNVFLAFDRQGGDGSDDELAGGAERDLLIGEEGNDTLLGNEGDDQLEGGADKDFLVAGDGDDTLRGGDDDDILEAGDGDDSLSGGAGDDMAFADFGNDLLFGAAGRDTADGGFGDDTLDGGADNDILIGSIGNDLLLGADGDDLLEGGAGFDTLEGGLGRDFLDGSFSDDSMAGGEGEDTLEGGFGNDGLLGEGGNDFLLGDAGADLLAGGDGEDTINAGRDNDSIDGGDGDDVINGEMGDDLAVGDSGNDLMNGGSGADSLDGGDGDDTVDGGFDNDLLFGGEGQDQLDGDFGNDSVDGGAGADTLQGGWGEDSLDGGDGDDSVDGGRNDDWLEGGAGNDELIGGLGKDSLEGGDDDDLLMGDEENDLLQGGDGNDTLKGGGGGDVLQGDLGDDLLYGGGGADQFRFYTFFGNDVLKDFSENDTVFLMAPLDVDEVSDLEVTQTDAGARVQVDEASSITFEGWNVAELDGADIVFLF